uniref:Integrase catalytic domain-containing protein n=1 Tax=Nicotiana tabacum TaxID=4097 RepID=A0A1S4DFZ9_TOBAC|nr:PREDICTED: uncharacterized protein LOC107829211 [Nicotiana tabacum]
MTIPEWKSDRIAMDFVVGLPRTLWKFVVVWVIVDRLTKSAHFVPVATTYTSNRLAKIYIREIVRLHDVPVFIISDRGPRCTSHFMRAVQSELGTRVQLNIVFHPQTAGCELASAGQASQKRPKDGSSKSGYPSAEAIPAGPMSYSEADPCPQKRGRKFGPMTAGAEIAGGSEPHLLRMALYEALYERRCRYLVGWFELSEARLMGTDLYQYALDKVKLIQGHLRTAQSRQKRYADRKVRDVSYMVGEKCCPRFHP